MQLDLSLPGGQNSIRPLSWIPVAASFVMEATRARSTGDDVDFCRDAGGTAPPTTRRKQMPFQTSDIFAPDPGIVVVGTLTATSA